MKLQFGTTQAAAVLEQFERWLPARADALRKIGKKARLGVEVQIAEIKPAHSDSARGLYWASLHQFAQWLGYSTREAEAMLHPLICAEAFGQDGEREITWKGKRYSWPVPRETSSKDSEGRKRDAETYGVLIETLLRFAAEQGYVIQERA
jgi:hypothetical protein